MSDSLFWFFTAVMGAFGVWMLVVLTVEWFNLSKFIKEAGL